MRKQAMQKAYFKEVLFVSFRFFILAGISISLIPCLLNAQLQSIQFKHLTIDDGLSNSWIRCIIQDKYGFLWFGTDDGLNCYDGNNFHVYKNSLRDKYSIANNYIMSMFEDSKGNLWIGTRQGLNIYDRKNDRFIRYPNLMQAEVKSIAEDKDKNLWVGTATELCYINLINSNINFYPTDSIVVTFQRDKEVNAILTDGRENVWIGSNNGLYIYDKNKKSFIQIFHDESKPNSLAGNNVQSILEDNIGRFWIGTDVGLDLIVNPGEKPSDYVFIHYKNDINDPNSISKGLVRTMLEDDKHNLWIGIENGGLDVLNLATYKKGVNSFAHFKKDPDRGTSLNNNSIYSLFSDKQGNIWIGTFGNGINIVNPTADKFIHIRNEPGAKNSLSNNQVNVFLEENNFLWIGTEGGLNRYNKKDEYI